VSQLLTWFFHVPASVGIACIDARRDDSADKLKQVYTVILYLTDGVDSTAFPQFTVDEFALPEFNSSQDVQNAAAMRVAVERGCLKKERYDRWPVRVGDMALFTQATMVSAPFRRPVAAQGKRQGPMALCLIAAHFRVCLRVAAASSAFWHEE